MPAKKKKAKAEARSRGFEAAKLAQGNPPAKIAALARSIEDDDGAVLATYRDPLGGHWQVLAALPIDAVEPTPFQRDLSEAHAAKLADVIGKLDRFLDPVIAVRNDEGGYWTPNGRHRLEAMRAVGARAIVALVVPEPELAYRILALNTEKAHNVREKALEVIRMARSLAELDPRPEREFALEFDDPSLLTLGLCYEQRGRFSGGVDFRSTPSRTIDPVSGRSNPAIIRSNVVFPQPEGPSSVKNSPAFTEKLTSSTATKSPKRRVTLRTSSSAMTCISPLGNSRRL